jgi:hypothetical protein
MSPLGVPLMRLDNRVPGKVALLPSILLTNAREQCLNSIQASCRGAYPFMATLFLFVMLLFLFPSLTPCLPAKLMPQALIDPAPRPLRFPLSGFKKAGRRADGKTGKEGKKETLGIRRELKKGGNR